MFDLERFRGAATRFKTFFTELNQAFVEREGLLVQIALGLICREHVLVAGPPGTAKSQIAAATLGRIVDETTGAPSLYARQFTENTVHTDLVGPIDFKTLMESGRTEHFTDEGMLGAVHAFLDEVFDGRDMLLRSALNVLNERELKQGTRTTKGRIECAVMTSNRYLSEILEGSRETLLAFVDRIAFVSFVPKGFANPANLASVVRRQAGGAGNWKFESSLTVQDLDALQDAADRVRMSDAACDALVDFVQRLDVELSSATRADPDFVATRYLSTRTVVRCAKVLRAACVFDKIFLDPERPFDVLPKDFAQLWTHLVLAGPDAAAAQKLLARETDPRERRQLSIVRTEREIFDRCLAKVPAFEPDARPPSVDVERLRTIVSASAASEDPAVLGHAARLVARAAAQGTPESGAASGLLDESLELLTRRALRVGLTAGVGRDTKSETVVSEICLVADELEQTSSTLRPTARWLRGRALAYLEGVLSLVPAVASDLEALVSDAVSSEAILQAAERRVESLERVAELRQRLISRGSVLDDAAASQTAWRRIVGRAEDDLAALWDTAFRRDVVKALREAPAGRLATVLERLGPALENIRAAGRRLAAMSGGSTALESRVVGPRIAPLVAAAFERIDAGDRLGLVGEVERLLSVLDAAGVASVLQPATVLAWAARALVRSAGETTDSPPRVATFDEYREFRTGEQRVPICFVLVEIALRFLSGVPRAADAGPSAVTGLRAMIDGVPKDLRVDIVRSEVTRIGRTVDVIEHWWTALSGALEDGDIDHLRATDASRRLALVASSGFLSVTRDEAALARFALEARLIRELLPDDAADADVVRARIDRLDERIHSGIRVLAATCADHAWSSALSDRTRGD